MSVPDLTPQPDPTGGILQGAVTWFYDPDEGQHYMGGNGPLQKVHPKTIQRRGLAAYLDEQQRRIARLTKNLFEGSISLEEWRYEMKLAVKHSFINAALLGAGGKEHMGASEWGAIGAMLKKQYKFIDGFSSSLERGDYQATPAGLAKATVRALMYPKAANTAFWYVVNSKKKKTAGYTHKRKVLAPFGDHCPDCIAEAALGWVDIDSPKVSEPGAGQTVCLTNCNCSMDYTKNPEYMQLPWPEFEQKMQEAAEADKKSLGLPKPEEFIRIYPKSYYELSAEEWRKFEQAEEQLKRAADDWWRGLSAAERKAVYSYTTNAGFDMNRILRGESVSVWDYDQLSRNIDLAIDALDRSAAPFDFKVWRGVGSGRGFFGFSDRPTLDDLRALVGTTMVEYGFASSTPDENEGRRWGQTVLEVLVRRGQKGAFLYTSEMSDHSSEREFLIPPGTVFRILDVREEGGLNYVTVDIVEQ
mgnify:FL=1